MNTFQQLMAGVKGNTETTPVDKDTVSVSQYATFKNRAGEDVEVIVSNQLFKVPDLQARRKNLMEQVAKLDEMLNGAS